jgi:hypothetical protein
VAVPPDEPSAVVAVDEAGHGLAELVDVVVQLDPQALVLSAAAAPSLSSARQRASMPSAQSVPLG